MFAGYLGLSNQALSQAQAWKRMFAKPANTRFLFDMRPLMPAAQGEAQTEGSRADSVVRVFTSFVDRLSGELWAGTLAMKARFGISW